MIPIIKWAGGKRKLSPIIASYLGTGYNAYYEPFAGGAAVMFYLEPKNAICFDINKELINFYETIKNAPTDLADELETEFYPRHSEQFYYEIRNWDREEGFDRRSPISRAARFAYLNKCCYNGLWRENNKGQNNVPWGHQNAPAFVSREQIISVSNYFVNKNVRFILGDYKRVNKFAKKGDLVYFDPPYDIEQGLNGFISYSANRFSHAHQIELKSICDSLINKGVKVAVSNSGTKFIKELYNDTRYSINVLSVQRNIGASIESRKEYEEVLIIGE
jgi:DNA adenine methylase